MTKEDVLSFMQTYQRVTQNMFKFAPKYASIIFNLNSDHQITAHTTLVAVRPISYHKVMPEIRCFETPSSTEQAPNVDPYIFKPNFYVCIENVWKKKIEAVNAYSKEIKKYPHPRSIKSIESLAIKRGSEVNLKKAEAFYIIRKVWK